MDYYIRYVKSEDLEEIQNIEQQAANLFSDTKYAKETMLECLSPDFLKAQQEKNLVWTAVNKNGLLLGFAVVLVHSDFIHLHELSVLPEFGKRGIGTDLTKTIIKWARKSDFAGVTLSTYKEIPWNAPFYQRLGFEDISEKNLSKELSEIRSQEFRAGLTISDRVFMRFDF